MICVICKNGETAAGTTLFMFEEDETIVVVKDVPAKVCNNCGEAYMDSQTTARLLDMSPENSERDHDVEVVVLKYGAASTVPPPPTAT